MKLDLTDLKKVSIRSAGLNEYWLQDKIFENPASLGLGDNLIPIQREKKQSSGGRLDILLQDPDDNNALYEVEVMLGETDESHIIRTLEYWDLERKRFPQRQHYAVLIAEHVTRRFYNVVQLLSFNFPLIAIEAQLLEVCGKHALNFVKVMDVYQEQGLDVSEEVVDEKHWKKNAHWVLSAAIALMQRLSGSVSNMKLNYTKSYISIMYSNSNLFYIYKRAEPNIRLEIGVRDEEKQKEVEQIFNEKNISFGFRKKYASFLLNIDQDFLIANIEVFHQVMSVIIEEDVPVEQL